MQVYSVAQFVEFLNAAFATAVFPEGVAVEGEVTGYRVSQGKWIWFDLKDEGALVSCFSTVWQLRAPLEDGMRVRVFGLPKIYPKSGRFSLTVERVELVGEGALRRAFELLKRKLADEGLFAPERKRPLPRFPRRIGLIASAESAAYGDFLRILGNRWGGLEIVLADVQVQGRSAAGQIVAAFRYFNEHPAAAEVLVLTRGGGSLEDLQAFNSEEVARAVFGSRLPVVVAVGHERDESLADHVADVRASTPSNAAEILVPDRREVAAALGGAVDRLSGAMFTLAAGRAASLAEMTGHLEAGVRRAAAGFDARLARLERHATVFTAGLRSKAAVSAAAAGRLAAAMTALAAGLGSGLAAQERLLRGLDPRRLLDRGYALVTRAGRLVRDAAGVSVGDRLDIRLARGRLGAEVKDKTDI